MGVSAEQVEAIRRFNRTVVQRVGGLQNEYLSRQRPLGQSRVLWEIGLGGAEVSALRARLDLDSGYLSRILRALEAEGMVEVRAGARDRRSRVAALTAAGRRERRLLDRRSDALAASMLDGLTERQRERLIHAAQQVERLLTASLVVIEPRPASDPQARWCVQQYFAEIAARFDEGFDPSQSRPVLDDELTPPAGLLLVATLHSEPVGTCSLKLHGRKPAEIKRMWVDASVRGLGVGRRLLDTLEREARAAGAPALRLDTNRSLTEAIRMYRAAGYAEVPPYNDEHYATHWFEKKLRP